MSNMERVSGAREICGLLNPPKLNKCAVTPACKPLFSTRSQQGVDEGLRIALGFQDACNLHDREAIWGCPYPACHRISVH